MKIEIVNVGTHFETYEQMEPLKQDNATFWLTFNQQNDQWMHIFVKNQLANETTQTRQNRILVKNQISKLDMVSYFLGMPFYETLLRTPPHKVEKSGGSMQQSFQVDPPLG